MFQNKFFTLAFLAVYLSSTLAAPHHGGFGGGFGGKNGQGNNQAASSSTDVASADPTCDASNPTVVTVTVTAGAEASATSSTAPSSGDNNNGNGSASTTASSAAVSETTGNGNGSNSGNGNGGNNGQGNNNGGNGGNNGNNGGNQGSNNGSNGGAAGNNGGNDGNDGQGQGHGNNGQGNNNGGNTGNNTGNTGNNGGNTGNNGANTGNNGGNNGNNNGGNAGNGGNNGGNDADAQTSLALDPAVIADGFAQDGQPSAGQVASLTSTNNFINFCLTVDAPITNGQQIQSGSCNPAPIGVIPSTDNMPSSKFANPTNFGTVQADTAFTIQMNVNKLVTGNFVNPQTNYFAAPQVLQNGQIVGHSHVVVELLDSIDQATPTDPKKFAFFKGLNEPAQNGQLTADVSNGLPQGAYRLCSINSSANHQPVIAPIAQHGSLDDCIYFTSE